MASQTQTFWDLSRQAMMKKKDLMVDAWHSRWTGGTWLVKRFTSYCSHQIQESSFITPPQIQGCQVWMILSNLILGARNFWQGIPCQKKVPPGVFRYTLHAPMCTSTCYIVCRMNGQEHLWGKSHFAFLQLRNIMLRYYQVANGCNHTVDGRNPAPVDR